MILLKCFGALWLLYLSYVFVRSFKESLRREQQRRDGAAREPNAPFGRNPFAQGPFGPFGPFGASGPNPFAEAARAQAEAHWQWQQKEQARARQGAQTPAAAAASRSAYDVLGVPPGADDKAIRRAYQDLIRQYHPDKLGAIDGLPQDLRDLAEQRTKEITAAYNLLKKKS